MRVIGRLGMVNSVGVMLLIIAGLGLAGAPGDVRANSDDEHSFASLVVFPAVAELNAKTNVVLLGTGYEPGQELRFLLGDVLGNQSDITLSMTSNTFVKENDSIAADSSGNFAANFNMGRFERVMYEAPWGIAAVDLEDNILSTAPLVFCDPSGRSRANVYKRGAPDYEKRPEDPRPAPFCAGLFDYPERPKS